MEADFISVLITGDYATLGATCLSAWKDKFRFRRCVGGPEGKQGSNFYPTLSVASFHQCERAPPEFIDTAGFYHYNHKGTFLFGNNIQRREGKRIHSLHHHHHHYKNIHHRKKTNERGSRQVSVRVYFCLSGHTKHTYDVYAANPLWSVSFFLSHIYAICTTFDEAGFCCVFRSPFLSLLSLSLASREW